MLINFTSDTETNPDKLKLNDLVDSLNLAIQQRLDNNGNVANVGTYTLTGKSGNEPELLNENPMVLNFTSLKFNFKNTNDPAGLRPLKGISGKTDNDQQAILGSTNSKKKVPVLVTDFDFITNITTYSSYAVDTKKHSTYGVRIVALLIEGTYNENAVAKLIIPQDAGDLGTSVDETGINIKVKEFNKRDGAYMIGQTTVPINLRLKLPTDPPQRIALFNIGAHLFEGKSKVYLDELTLYFCLQEQKFNLDSSKVDSLSFGLDFEYINWRGEGDAPDTTGFGTYEISYQAITSDRNLDITQKGSSHTLSIPSVGAGMFQIGSPYSYTKTSMKRSETEVAEQVQTLEKLVMKLPPQYFQLQNFTATRIEDVTASVNVTFKEDKGVTTIDVPLCKKVLLCKTLGAVATSVITSI